MTALEALLLGVVEGLTEFLPVSSTGHLVLLGSQFGHDDEATKALEVVIQLGAVLAAVVYYRSLLAKIVRGLLVRDKDVMRLVLSLGIATVPVAVIGLLFHKKIKAWGFAPAPVAAALILGGVAMIGLELYTKRMRPPKDTVLSDVGPKRALAIGAAQCLSLWPGMSRSMTTILGGQLTGLKTATAAEFTFLLAIPVLGSATLFDLAKHGKAIVAAPGGALSLVIGLTSAFVVALAVIAVFLRYLKRYGLAPFGVYRILLGVVVLVFVR